MTTYFTFTPSPVQAFQFQPTLDGNQNNVIVTWNPFGKRYYVNVFALDGTLVVSIPLVGSSAGKGLEALTWDLESQEVTVTTSVPHALKVGTFVELNISGCNPTTYNGLFPCFITGPSNFTYPLSTDPGLLLGPGSASYDVDLVGGYFTTSRMVYRDGTQQFEVTP